MLSPLLAPERARGFEILDNPDIEPAVMARSMKDVVRANRLFGGRRAALAELMPAFPGLQGSGDLLDIGAGLADITVAAKNLARSLGVTLRTTGIDSSQSLVALQRGSMDAVVRGDGLALPFADRSVDIVMASQVLHHFQGESAVTFVREMNRVAKWRVVISDLRRSRLAAAGIWLGSFPLGFHPISRHDGVVSVMRGFVPAELAEIVEAATGQRPEVHRRLGFRLTTSWNPEP